MLRKLIYAVSAVGLIIMGKYLLGNDFLPFLQWYIVVFSIGIIFIPCSDVLFSSLIDRGYLFSKTIGIAITGYLMWLMSSLHIMKFRTLSCYIAVLIGLFINLTILYARKKKSKAVNRTVDDYQRNYGVFTKNTMNTVLMEELLFLAVFLLFAYIKGFKPEAYGTEKFMDYGFMTTLMRSDYMPPQDFWFSGTSLNYYYVGQFFATYLSKLTFVGTAIGYNLMLMMTGAFAFVLPFSLGYNLIYHYVKERRKKRGYLPAIGGLLTGAGVCIAGNMHFPIYRWFVPWLRKTILAESVKGSYWFPNATRYIGYHPETNDKTIHEFPSYSFVLGDLHAHVINILFVLTLLAILLGWLYGRPNKREEERSLLREIIHPSHLMLGFFIGLFHTTNYWDFPIYYVVSGAVILFSNMVVYNFKGKAYWLTALQGIVILLVGELISLPFTLRFRQISATPLFTVAWTPLYQLMVLWGLPFITVAVFLMIVIFDFRKSSGDRKYSGTIKERSVFFRFLQGLKYSDLFVITIGLCAMGLVLIPEIIYIKDIYSGDYKRANTMFKLTYQAFILFGISFGYIFVRLLAFGRNRGQKIIAAVGLFFFLSTLLYSGNAVKSWFGNVFDRKAYEGLDATAFMEEILPEDDLATQWLNANVTGTPIVLEANGDSYTKYQRVSVITGLPTVLGWHTHEWLWQSEVGVTDSMVVEKLNIRTKDIETIYTSMEEETVRNLLKQYDVSYIYVGGLEKEKYATINHELLKMMGTVVYEVPPAEGNDYETYIVKVK